jgi:hypothetical protein
MINNITRVNHIKFKTVITDNNSSYYSNKAGIKPGVNERNTFKFNRFICFPKPVVNLSNVSKKITLLLIVISSILQINCEEKKVDTNQFKPGDEYTAALLLERAQKDSSMQYEPYSPFNRDPKTKFSSLKYFEPTTEFIFKSKLFEFDAKDTVDVFGTRGELRRVIKFGYVKLDYKGKEYRINVYKAFSRSGQVYYSIWFTDKTTGKETYGVGRYLDFELNEDKNYFYTIDFNRVYNPYCAYSAEYTCPIPREEDYIDLKILAGEKNFH